jgi:lipopolysaccharide export system protein LptA
LKKIASGILIFTLLLPALIQAQNKAREIELLNANSLEFDENLGGKTKRLLGDVRFRHEGALMFCDSAYYFDDNKLDAFGHVKLVQGDTVTLTGEIMHYDGNTKKADIQRNVVLKEKKMTLTTQQLYYDREKGIAHYLSGGKIVTEENTLTSLIAYYYNKEKMLHFHKNVVLVNPDYTIKTDTLKQNTQTDISYFLGPTYMTTPENDKIYCENGWYNSKTDKARFGKNTRLENKNQTITGDSIYYDKPLGYGRAVRHVSIHDTAEKIILKGHLAEFFEKQDYSYITDSAMMLQYDKTDTLFLHADTLKSTYDSVYFSAKKNHEKAHKKTPAKKGSKQIEPSPEPFKNDSLAERHRILLAWRHVRFYRKDMQGVCDSLAYTGNDSLMKMYVSPILWNEANQLNGDFMQIKLSGGTLYFIDQIGKAFIGSQLDSVRYNQIKGKRTRGFFLNNELHLVRVKGNAMSIYYARDDEDSSYVGINNAKSTDMDITMANKKVHQISFLQSPDALMSPVKGSSPSENMLEGFTWFGTIRPNSRQDIFRKPESPNIKPNQSTKGYKKKAR